MTNWNTTEIKKAAAKFNELCEQVKKAKTHEQLVALNKAKDEAMKDLQAAYKAANN